MTMDLEYVADEREFSNHILDNGLKCYFVRDPSLEKVSVDFLVTAKAEELPVELEGLSQVVTNLTWRGSAHYPGALNFKEFVDDNDIRFQHFSAYGHQETYSEVPFDVLDVFLSRLADMITYPEFSKDGLEYAKLMGGQNFYTWIQDDSYRSLRVFDTLLCTHDKLVLELYKRKDIILRVREYFCRHYCPSKMILLLSGNLPCEQMRKIVEQKFDWIPRKTKVMFPSIKKPHFCPSDEKKITLARTFTKNDTKSLTITFLLLPGMSTSSPLYIAYLLNTSQPGSLHYKLKAEGLIKDLHADHYTVNKDTNTLELTVSQTEKGSKNSLRILSLLMGYIETIRELEPDKKLFKQAHDFFVCLRKQDSQQMRMNRMLCEIKMGASLEDLRFAEIPRKFDPAEIRLCAEFLLPKHCIAVALSNAYADAPVNVNSEYYLQYFVDEVTIEPCVEGLSVPNLDPLVVGSRVPKVLNEDLRLLRPNVYFCSSASATRSTVKMDIKSPTFSKFPFQVQQLYTEMIKHKLVLVTNSRFIEINLEATSISFSVSINCLAESLCRVLFLVSHYLSNPLEDDSLEKLLELRNEKERMIDTWLSGDSEIAYHPDFEEILREDIDLAAKKQQLQAVTGLSNLPQNVTGEIVVLFGGNVHPRIAHMAFLATAPLHVTSQLEVSLDVPTNVDTKRIISRDYFQHSSVCKIFNAGSFSHTSWTSLSIIARIITEVFSQGILPGPLTNLDFTARPIRRYGFIWLQLELSSDVSEHELERRLDKCILMDLSDLILKSDQRFMELIRDLVWDELLSVKADFDAELSRLWASIKEDPQDCFYLDKMKQSLLSISTKTLRDFYMQFLSDERRYGTHTLVWKPSGSRDMLQDFKYSALGVYKRGPISENKQEEDCDELLYRNANSRLVDAIATVNDILESHHLC